MGDFRLISKRALPVDRGGEAFPREALTPDKYRDIYEQKWAPPEGRRTFADYDKESAARIAARRPHVILRGDPMFGRRGYAKGVLADPTHGFLVLVIAYVSQKNLRGEWQEPIKPKDCDRQYWPPGHVEFAPQ